MAPGRVNLIGEHKDYTGGFVFPMAIAYSTVCYGQGTLVDIVDNNNNVTLEDVTTYKDQLLLKMNASHDSMRNDYDVSCYEIDILVNLAQSHTGVYGSGLTGGGFGGCTVTLVDTNEVDYLISYMTKQYKLATNKDCFTFQTSPEAGARQLTIIHS